MFYYSTTELFVRW